MEGIFYYWVMWGFWIITTFWMKKNNVRFWFSFFILSNIAVSHLYWQLKDFSFNFSYLLFLIFGMMMMNQTKHYIFSVFSVLTISFAYAAIKLVYVYDPVLFWIDIQIVSAIMTCWLSLLLGRKKKQSFAYLLTGLCYGEALFWFIISSIYKPVTVGGFPFLETIVLSNAFLFLWELLKGITNFLEQLVEKTVKEKQERYE